MKTIAILLLVMTLTSLVMGQDFTPSTKWSGEVRVRSEVDMRDFNNLTPANTYTLLRSRLGFEALPVENVKAFLQVQDSRTFGQEQTTQTDLKNLDLHQGYLEVSKFISDNMTLKLGRMELAYANERILGAVNWHNFGRVFDGGLLKINTESFGLDIMAMNHTEVQPYQPIGTTAATAYVWDGGYDVYGGYATFKGIENQKIDGYLLYQWNRTTTVVNNSDLARFTLGGYGKGKFDAIDYEAELAYQGGKVRDLDAAAYMLTATLGYSLTDMPVSRLAVGYELLSGTPTGDTKYKSFDPTFHTGHKFYGFMDYFINIPVNTGGRGLADLLVRATMKVSDQGTLNFWFHNFSLAEDVNGEKGLGQEIDLTYLCKYNSNVNLELGASTFIPGELMRSAFGTADAAFWGYFSTTVNF